MSLLFTRFALRALIFFTVLLFSCAVSACGPHQYSSLPADSADAPVYAPVPEGASGPALPPEGYITQSLGKGAYVVTEGSYQALFFVTTNSVVLVDAPATAARFLPYAIGNITSNPVTHLIYSHFHTDHIAGAVVFAELNPKLEIIAHKETKRHLEEIEEDASDRPIPTKTFDRKYKLTVENQTLELAFNGDNHSDDNIFIWAPKQAILMLVDVIVPRYAPFLSLGVATSVAGFIRAHDQALAYPFETFIGGHLNQPGTRQDVLLHQEYVRDLFNSCRDAVIASGDPSAEVFINNLIGPAAAANPGNSWATFGAYYRGLARYCGSRIRSRWTDRLAGVDVFEQENAVAMIESLRIDYGILGPFGVQR